LSKSECMATIGGATITAAFLSALKGLLSVVYSFGQDLGQTLRKVVCANGRC